MANYLTTDTELTSIADAIRAKIVNSVHRRLRYPDGFISAIEGIDIPVDTDVLMYDEDAGECTGEVFNKETGSYSISASYREGDLAIVALYNSADNYYTEPEVVLTPICVDGEQCEIDEMFYYVFTVPASDVAFKFL